MKLRSILVITAFLGLFAGAVAQPTEAQEKESERILNKVREVELYNQILPVLLSADQAKDLMLILERHRSDANRMLKREHSMLRGIEKTLDAAIKEAADKGRIPDPKTLIESINLFRTFQMKRKALVDDTVGKLKSKMREKLNEGQVRSAANSFNPRLFDASLKPDEMTEDTKLDYWVRIVLLDDISYKILVDLAKKKK